MAGFRIDLVYRRSRHISFLSKQTIVDYDCFEMNLPPLCKLYSEYMLYNSMCTNEEVYREYVADSDVHQKHK